MKILNYGSLNIDYTYEVEHFVRGGETLSSLNLQTFSGGKGLNQSIALSKSGVEVWHAGAVGESDGDFLLEQLREAGVNVDFVQHVQGKTGHAIIQKDLSGQNCILLYGGANQKIGRVEIQRTLGFFAPGDFLILQNEISEISFIMEKAHEKGMKIVLNPSPMDEKIMTYPLEYVDYFLLNEVEAEGICDQKGTGRQLLQKTAEKFPNAFIVLTLGGDGSLFWDGKRMIEQVSYPVEVRDTTAAGDTFTGFFIGGLVKGKEPKEALYDAARAASIAVSRVGAAPSIPTWQEVERFRTT